MVRNVNGKPDKSVVQRVGWTTEAA